MFVNITAIVQPYKKQRDNIITILCISNIILINLISICHLYFNKTQSNKNLQLLLWLQLFLVLLPFAFYVVFVGRRSWNKFKAFWKQQPMYTSLNTTDVDELDDFPTRALEYSNEQSTSSASPHLKSPNDDSSLQIGKKEAAVVAVY